MFNMSCVGKCPKSTDCPLWIVLTNIITLSTGEVKNELVGKCAFAWLPQLLVELKGKGI